MVLGAVVIGSPAVLLRVFCVGRACERPVSTVAKVPFCSLPAELRGLIEAGYRDGRSPDVVAVTGTTPVLGGTDLPEVAPPWPSVNDTAPVVPLVFVGKGVASRPRLPEQVTLDRIAPTAAALIGLDRPHPEVRSGTPIESVIEEPGQARLLLEVVWVGIGSQDLTAARGDWPALRSLLRDGAGTLRARAGSLPLDPAAVLTTIGTGGLPRQHGITGTLVRNEQGRLVYAWGRGTPFSVIAALGDDLDELRDQEPRIGIVAADRSHLGAIGGNWYLDTDQDDIVIGSGRASAQSQVATDLLRSGYGHDETPDLLVVTMRDSIEAMDRALQELVDAAGDEAVVVVTSTGSMATQNGIRSATLRRDLEARIGSGDPVVEAMGLGGVFVNQETLAARDLSEDSLISALRETRTGGGRPLFADVFSSIAVSLARYC